MSYDGVFLDNSTVRFERLLPGRFNADDIAKFRATQPAKPKPTAVSLRLASEPWRELLYDE